jgi:hypothetical protein
LILWWRDEIFLRLSERKDLPQWVDRLRHRTTGIAGFVSAALGGAYLLVQGVLRRLLRVLSTFDLGKRVLAYFFRREVAKQSERQRSLAAGRPISLELAQRLLERGDRVLDKVGEDELQALVTLSRSVERGTGALIGERGSGKTRLLERLEAQLGDAVLRVDCPRGGFEGLLREFARTLGLPGGAEANAETIGRALTDSPAEVVAIDNYHRLTLPAIGGLDEIDRLLSLEASVDPEISWIISIDSAAWQYIRRLRSDLLLAHQIVELRPWTDDQIGELIEARNGAAGISPDFDELVLPAHLNENDFEGDESTQSGFYRILWDSARGNPEVALRLWIQSLAVLEDGRLAVRLFPPASYDELERLDPLMLFGLRAILRLELATADELRSSLRISEAQVGEILRSALNMGLIERVDDRYWVPWRWYRPLSTVLRRRNLMKD